MPIYHIWRYCPHFLKRIMPDLLNYEISENMKLYNTNKVNINTWKRNLVIHRAYQIISPC
jgi:hypothetical protein